jgi:hypothetical protein
MQLSMADAGPFLCSTNQDIRLADGLRYKFATTGNPSTSGNGI